MLEVRPAMQTCPKSKSNHDKSHSQASRKASRADCDFRHKPKTLSPTKVANRTFLPCCAKKATVFRISIKEKELEEHINVENTKPRDNLENETTDKPKGSMKEECWQSIKSHPLETGLAAASMAALAIFSRGKVLPRLLIEEAEVTAKAPAPLKLVHSAPNVLTANTKTAFSLRLASKDGQLASGFQPTLNLDRTTEKAKPVSKLAD